MFKEKRDVVGLIGFPVTHSLSPVIHNAAIRELGLHARYEVHEVRRGEVGEYLALQPDRFLGTNVTIPHKREVIESMRDLSPTARATGAVNTVIVKSDSSGQRYLYGDNTDVAGFLAPLQSHEVARPRIENGRVVILGAGGAARAVAYAVQEFTPDRITIVARSPAKGERLVEELQTIASSSQSLSSPQFVVEPFDSSRLSSIVAASDLIVNATPIGLTPLGHITPLPDVAFRDSHVVYDLVYRPRQTRLLRDATRAGALAIDGVEMLLAQAAASFVQWFGQEMPLDVVREALDDALSAES
ncbi:MAG: shikimate dehydrogenase [Rhodothermales bacterium]|nr:shikimate dehydrogenase [Rhodothermales bacterium]